MDWMSLLPALGAGAVFGAAITQLATWAREASGEKRRQQREAVYTAMRAAVALEAFAWACDEHLQDRSGEQAMGMVSNAGKLPRLAELPANVDWRSFDTRLASDVLGFPARIDAAQNQAFRSSFEESDHWESEPAATILGDAALQLAMQIRRRYSLTDGAVPLLVAERLREKKIALDRRKEEWRVRMEQREFAIAPPGAGV